MPFSYENDGQFYAVLVKQVIHGWYFTNPRLGAPFGSELLDFPQGADQLHFLIIKALGLASSDWALVMNLFFLLSFPLVALSAYAVMRRLGASPPSSSVGAALFALLPYHFRQGEFHLFLSAYYAVPLGCYLVIATYRGDPLFARNVGRRSAVLSRRDASGRSGILAWASPRSLATLALCCVVGSADIYYAAFTVVLLAFAAVVCCLLRRSWRALAGGLIPAAAILAVVILDVSPSLVYRAVHGTDSQAFIRAPAQSKQGSLAPGDLLLPLSDHRVAGLGRLRQSYSGPLAPPEFASSEGESATLGLLASAGFVWLVVSFTAVAVGVARGRELERRFAPIAAGALSAFLFATVGGTAVAYLLTPDIRQWMRLSIFIGFFSLLAVSLLLDQLGARLRRGRGGRTAFALLLVGIGALAFLDQTSSEFIPPYRELAVHYDSDQAFVAAIERRLPPGSAVFELPYMPWPEPGFVNHMTSFAPARGYLHSRSLRWSYGAMRGRPADWQAQLDGQPPAVVVAAAVAAGFGGIYIGRLGYAGSASSRLEAALSRLLRAPPIVSRDGQLSFFDARAYARRLRGELGPERWSALRQAALSPLRLDAGPGVQSPPTREFPITGIGIHGPVHVRRRGELEAVSPSAGERSAIFSARLSLAGRPSAVTVRFPAGRPLRLLVGRRQVAVCGLLQIWRTVPITFQLQGSAPLRIAGARLTDTAYEPFVPSGPCVR